MRILFFGDVVGQLGRKAIVKYTLDLVKKYQIDFVIANGENATHGKGLNLNHYNELLDAGVDAITLGNHYLGKKHILDFIDDADRLIRPLNLINNIGGQGSRLFTVNNVNIRVTNVLGLAFMKDEVIEPYQAVHELLDSIQGEDSIHIIDYHGEATGEKMCFGYVFDGLVSAIVGTHTHVQTNDAKILENGTGFISDIGMCGDYDGVLGFEKTSVINKTMFGVQELFNLKTEGRILINAVVLDIDDVTKKCKEIFPIKVVD